MSADEVEGAGRPFLGFHTFADDTPRDIPQTPAAGLRARGSWTTPPEDWAGPIDEPGLDLRTVEQRRPTRRSGRKGWWLALLAVGLVGGSALAIGLGVERQARNDKQLVLNAASAPMPIRVAPQSEPLAMAVVGAPEPITSNTSAPAAQTRPASLSPAPATTAPKAPAADRLALLVEQFPSGRGQPAPAAPPAAAETATPKAVSAPPILPDVPAPQTAELTPPPPRPSPAESCRYARTRAELLVCSDPELAAEDRQVTLAYRAAIAAGAPQGRLAREQRDWLNAREDASRRSRRDVANLYALRLDDLAQWLDDN